MGRAVLRVLGLFLSAFAATSRCMCWSAPDAVLTVKPNRFTLFTGESVTFTCDIDRGGDAGWSYTFTRDGQHLCTRSTNKPYSLKLTTNCSGQYQCIGRHPNGNAIAMSNKVTLNVSVKPVLTVSPSWLSPGALVTLKCEVEHPSAGWRFYWYKAVPDLSNKNGFYYRHELLPDSASGTEQDSYVVRGQTQTARYVCRAGRGDPVVYTNYSNPKFVWVGDCHSASIKVSPDSAQHFYSDSVLLSCEGGSAEWRAMRFTEARHLSCCLSWGAVNGSTCNINNATLKTAVYWCESETGQFSDAVNITQQNNIILVSPAHPVAEGDCATLGCKLKTGGFVSNVLFYRNGHLVQNDSSWKLTISAVSKSDEGFYKCESSGKVSLESWVAVRSVTRQKHTLFYSSLIIGLVFACVVLLLLWCCRTKSKDWFPARMTQPQTTNQSSAPDQVVYQNAAELGVHPSHSHSQLRQSSEAPYSLIQFENFNKRGSSPADNVYSEIRL